MLSINPKQVSTGELHQHLLGAVAPRPICFASTISKDGQPNLAPYSFFNAFSSNPPTLVFSSNRRVKDNTTKDTLHNVIEQGEVVINVVSYSIVHQMAATSIDFPTNVSEFTKAGLTPIPSDIVKPFRVKESPVQMECKVKNIISLGEHGGAGNLIICEVVRMHIDENILDEEGKIDPQKIDLMGRMGRAFYCRAKGDNIMKIFQPVNEIGIGVDSLPETVRLSKILTGNDLGRLGRLTQTPTIQEINERKATKEIIALQHIKGEPRIEILHQIAKKLIAENKVKEALTTLFC